MSIFSPLEHALHISWVLQASVVAAALALVFGAVVRRRLAAPDGGLVPDEGVSFRNVAEILVEFLADLGRTTMGEEYYRRYFPVVGAMFFFILIANVMGLIPAVGGATSDVNVPLAWAIISFVVYNAIGIRQHGWKYVYQFMGPVLWEPEIGGKKWHVRPMAPIFLVLEIPLHFARILTLTVRLLANMFADHTVVSVFIGLVPVAIPALFMGLGLLIAFLQAFVFTLLTMIYIGLALEEAH